MDIRDPRWKMASTPRVLETLRGTLHKTEKVVRGVEAPVTIKIKTGPTWDSLSPETQEEVLREVARIGVADIDVDKRYGDLTLSDKWLGQYVVPEIEQGRWEYDGGDVHTLEAKYDRLKP